ncbi:uncharacterized protein SCHCODRAFT_02208413 [Schizophyllum commune H4-8]|uniref:uncharacterized protein n=1 Tax=Schizophyllum commune (strain H4-8 / FGSC 9210) TaxID=578458 RepID=UPI002160D7DA|nr:uncharacterized protein SCHCODRAFT_02208413 [Schizophyllum commune H4-8]KAI5897220.1 hypothetical protein SCHCODRAFT_02208413 [Schizophyllum commune H4-8]
MRHRRAHDARHPNDRSGIANVTLAVLEACSVVISRIWTAGAVSCGGGVPRPYFFRHFVVFGGCCGLRSRGLPCPQGRCHPPCSSPDVNHLIEGECRSQFSHDH